MSETFVIAAAQGQVNAFSPHSYAEQVQPVAQGVLEKSGVPARRIQELHWFGGPEEFWFSSLGERLAFAPDLSRFQWPAVPILTHTVLQSISRAVQLGERDLVLLAQQSGEQLITLLLASPAAVGRHNLAPRARIALRLSLSRQPDGFLKAAQTGIEKSELESKEVQCFASPGRFNRADVQSVFPAAQPLPDGATKSFGDLFLLDALIRCLEESDTRLGLLLSPAPHGGALATLVERT